MAYWFRIHGTTKKQTHVGGGLFAGLDDSLVLFGDKGESPEAALARLSKKYPEARLLTKEELEEEGL